jgi:hypothetical protein
MNWEAMMLQNRKTTKWIAAVTTVLFILSLASLSQSPPGPVAMAQEPTPTYQVYLPIVQKPPLPPDVYLMLSTHTYYTSYGDLHIVGEIYNHTQEIIHSVKVYGDLFNENGLLIDTEYDYLDIDNVQPEMKTCFHLEFYDPPGWSRYELAGTYYHGGNPLPNLTVYADNAYLEADGDYKVLGMIRNDDTRRVTFVKPVVTLLDTAGYVIDCDFTYANIDDLNPGESSSFEETFWERDYSVVARYRIQVDGNPQ